MKEREKERDRDRGRKDRDGHRRDKDRSKRSRFGDHISYQIFTCKVVVFCLNTLFKELNKNVV